MSKLYETLVQKIKMAKLGRGLVGAYHPPISFGL
jgi:hypothetical protein